MEHDCRTATWRVDGNRVTRGANANPGTVVEATTV
jgi:hypothetical protein